MRRIIIVLLAIILTFSLLGCSDGDSATQNDRLYDNITPEKETSLPTESISQETDNTPRIEYTAEPTYLLDVKFVSATENIPVYDTASTENFVIPSQPQNPDLYESSYLHFNRFAHMDTSGNAVRICADEMELNRGSHYSLHVAEGNEIRELENIHFSKTYDLYGRTYLLEFDYVEYNGTPFLTYRADEEDTTCYVNLRLIGDEYVWIASFIEPNSGGCQFWFLDPETGDLTSLFQNIDPAKLDTIPPCYGIQYLTLLDRTRFLLRGSNDDFYYFDTTKRLVHNITELVGTDLTGCIFAGEDIVCMYEDTHDAAATYVDFWKVDTSDFAVKLLLSNIKDATRIPFNSDSYSGSYSNLSFTFFRLNGEYHMYALLNEQDVVITVPDGWVWGASLFASPDGRKFYTASENSVLILNCDKMEFLELILDNPNQIQYADFKWTADGKFIVWADHTDFYVYDLK